MFSIPALLHLSKLTPPQASFLACPKNGGGPFGGPPLPLCPGPRPPSSPEGGSVMMIELNVEAEHSWPCKCIMNESEGGVNHPEGDALNGEKRKTTHLLNEKPLNGGVVVKKFAVEITTTTATTRSWIEEIF